MDIPGDLLLSNLKLPDLNRLQSFFLKAYGPQTVFQDQGFLKWYFFDQNEASEIAAGSNFIVDTSQNQIVSFYGAIESYFLLKGKKVRVTWGVSAYTLPEWQGQGFNARLLAHSSEQAQVHGVIGFTKKAAGFYHKLGYNLFDFRRFSRFVYIISQEQTSRVLMHLHPGKPTAIPFLKKPGSHTTGIYQQSIQELTTKNVKDMEVGFSYHVALTTLRDIPYLRRRFIDNPFIKYQVFGFVLDRKIRAFVACRTEKLAPLGITVCRIIDMFGEQEAVAETIRYVAAKAEARQFAYLDFSCFGEVFTQVLLNAGFCRLDNEQYALLPQVTAPVMPRPNMEFAGLKSTWYSEEINSLTVNDVYFTRADSDRDRIALISQLPSENNQVHE